MVIHGKLLFVNYLFVKQFTYYSFLLNLQSKQATTMKIRLEPHTRGVLECVSPRML